jgi:hypothetical protein
MKEQDTDKDGKKAGMIKRREALRRIGVTLLAVGGGIIATSCGTPTEAYSDYYSNYYSRYSNSSYSDYYSYYSNYSNSF